MDSITLWRAARLPDDLRVSRCLSAPHLGPKITFFSGGSALNGTARALKRYTFNSAHLITPFDSGGSSQVLREAFNMPAVGDLRSRLMALADETELGQPEIYALFSHRLPKLAAPEDLAQEFQALVEGQHPLIRAVQPPMRALVLSDLEHFRQAAPNDFDFRNASVGNLILAGGYLSHDRALEPVLFLMSKMVDVRGIVRSVVDETLHLGADLLDGTRVIGQKQMTGKETEPLTSPIRRLFLSDGEVELDRRAVPLPDRNRRLVERADLICYPPGSLFSSVIANLLPDGVGRAVAACRVPKVYVPSLGHDPECSGMTLADQVGALIEALRDDAGQAIPTDWLVSHVICDSQVPQEAADAVSVRHGITCLRMPLTGAQPGRYDPDKLCRVLVSLV